MKKILSVAIMALTLVLTGCYRAGSTVAEPKIDENKHTVNGIPYDNEEFKCWLFEWDYTTTYGGWAAQENEPEHDFGAEYFWDTEFEIMKYKAQFDYAANIRAQVPGASVTTKGSSSVTEAKGKDEYSCYSDEE